MAAGQARAGKAYIELGVRSKLSAGLKAAQRRLESFGKRVKSVSDRINQVGVRLSAMGLAAGAGIGFAAKTFADFDDQMRLLKAVTGATSDEFEKLTEQAKLLGRTTSFTASQVAAGMVEMGRAGFQSSEILVATEQVLALSRATATELPRAAEIAGAALRGFALPASEMERVVNVLSTAVNGSAQTLEDFFEGVKFVAPVAAEAGASIEDVSAAMAILANNGIKGSLAGNALTRAYKNLSTELKQSELAEFGVEAVDAAGNLRPLSSIIADLGAATDGLGSAKRLAVFESLFGRGQASALKLASSGAQFDDIRDGLLNIEKTAVDVAEEMNSGLGGAFRSLASAAEGTTIAIGDALAEPLQRLSERIGQVLGYLTEWINTNPSVVVGVAKVTAAVLAAGAGLIALSVAASGMSVAISGAAVALKAAVVVFNPLTVAIGAVAGAFALFGTESRAALHGVGNDFEALKTDASSAIEGIKTAIANGNFEVAGDIAMVGLELAFERGLGSIQRLWNGWIDDLAIGLIELETALSTVFRNSDTAIGAALTGVGMAVGNEALVAQGFGFAQRGGAFDSGISEERDARVAIIESQRASRERQLQKRLEGLANRLEELRREIAVPRPAPDEPPDRGGDQQFNLGDDVADRIANAVATGTQQTENLRTMTRGTFSAFAAGRINSAMDQVQREQLSQLKAIARNTSAATGQVYTP